MFPDVLKFLTAHGYSRKVATLAYRIATGVDSFDELRQCGVIGMTEYDRINQAVELLEQNRPGWC